MNAKPNLKKTMNILEFLELQSGNKPKPTLKNSSKSRNNPTYEAEHKISGFIKLTSFNKTTSIKKTSLCNSPKAHSKKKQPKQLNYFPGHTNKPSLVKTQMINQLNNQYNVSSKNEAFYSAHSNDHRPKLSSPRNNWISHSLNNSFEKSQLGNSFRVSLEEHHRQQIPQFNTNDNMILKFNRKPTEKKIKQYPVLIPKIYEEPENSLLETKVKPKTQQVQHSTLNHNEKAIKQKVPNPAEAGIYYTISCLRYSPDLSPGDIKIESYLEKLSQEFPVCSKFMGLLKAPDKTILLPEKRDKHTPTIIIDLFNTLIKCKVKTERNGSASLIIKSRPFLRFFLGEISSRAELVIFSSSNSKLVQQVLDEIDPARKYFANILTKEHCTPLHGT